MFLFGNKKKKLKKENESLKNQVSSAIATLMSQAKEYATTEKLKGLQDLLSKQASSDQKEALELLKEAAVCVQNANQFVATGKYKQANSMLDKAAERINKRAAFCGSTTRQVGGMNIKLDNVVIEESNEDKLRAQLDAAQDEYEKIKREVEGYQKDLKRNPNDFAAKAKLQSIGIKFKTVENNMIRASNALATELARLGRKQEAEQIKENAQLLTVSDEENEINKDFIAENDAKVAEDMADVSEYMNTSAGAFGMATEGAMDSFGSAFNVDTTGSQMAAAAFGSTSGSGMGMGMGMTSGYGATANPYGGGGNNNSPLGSKAEINKMTSILEQSQADYNEKLEAASDELKDYDAALRSLLQKRQGATPSECLVLDGQIDQLNAKRNKVAHTVKRLRNAIAQLDEQLTLMGKVEFQQDLESMKNRIQQLTGGRYADIEGLSTYLKDAIKKENEELENLGVGNAIVDSEEINMNSFSGANAAFTDMTNVKDEDKYAALEAELGLATR